jgi:hypothetical protein
MNIERCKYAISQGACIDRESIEDMFCANHDWFWVAGEYMTIGFFASLSWSIDHLHFIFHQLGANPNLGAGRVHICRLVCTYYTRRSPNIIRVLLDYGADPNYKDENGETAAMYAVANGHLDCLRILADGGPGGKFDRKHVNNIVTGGVWAGQTILDLALALEWGHAHKTRWTWGNGSGEPDDIQHDRFLYKPYYVRSTQSAELHGNFRADLKTLSLPYSNQKSLDQWWRLGPLIRVKERIIRFLKRMGACTGRQKRLRSFVLKCHVILCLVLRYNLAKAHCYYCPGAKGAEEAAISFKKKRLIHLSKKLLLTEKGSK